MRAIILNEQEMELLAGLPHLQFRLYVILRWVMDKASRKAGSESAISHAWLARELEVEVAQGRHAEECGRPSRKAIRSAVDQLEKRGLIQPCGNGEMSVFLLPKASVVFARPKHEGPMRGQGEGPMRGQPKAAPGKGLESCQQVGGATPEKGRGAILRYQVNPISVEATAAAQPLAVEPDLSTSTVLLSLQPADIADFIRASERLRGKLPDVVSTDGRLMAWVRKGLTRDLLQEAYQNAVNDRDVRKNPSPINVGFLDVFVQRVLNGRMASKKVEEAGASSAWHTTEDGIARRAVELGVEPMRPGESLADFRGRVSFAESEAFRAERMRRDR